LNPVTTQQANSRINFKVRIQNVQNIKWQELVQSDSRKKNEKHHHGEKLYLLNSRNNVTELTRQ